MTVDQALRRAAETLASHNIDEAPLEAEVFLMHVLNFSRVQLYSQLKRQISPEQARRLFDLVTRRVQGEPTAYIVEHKEFFGHDFQVDRRVLIPRPETELLVEKALVCGRDRLSSLENMPLITADIGTGCAAIAISLALELTGAKIYATDISLEALEVAKVNCEKHGVAGQVHLLWGDMLDPLPEPVHLIVANLPYVKDVEIEQLPPEIRGFEPRIALAGGADGLDKVRRLLAEAKGKLRSGGAIFMEIDPRQSQDVVELAKICFPTSEVHLEKDLSDLDRVATVET